MTKAIRFDSSLLRAATIGLLLAGATLGLSACNTVNGAGKDVSSAGAATSTAASSVQQKM
jgi:predicted small secreted protein